MTSLWKTRVDSWVSKTTLPSYYSSSWWSFLWHLDGTNRHPGEGFWQSVTLSVYADSWASPKYRFYWLPRPLYLWDPYLWWDLTKLHPQNYSSEKYSLWYCCRFPPLDYGDHSPASPSCLSEPTYRSVRAGRDSSQFYHLGSVFLAGSGSRGFVFGESRFLASVIVDVGQFAGN